MNKFWSTESLTHFKTAYTPEASKLAVIEHHQRGGESSEGPDWPYRLGTRLTFSTNDTC